MDDPTAVKAGHVPATSRLVLALLERDATVGRTGRIMYQFLYAIAGTRKQSFAGVAVYAKLFRVQRQAVTRAVKELSDAGLLVMHENKTTLSLIVPSTFAQETLVLYSLASRDYKPAGDAAADEALAEVLASAPVQVPIPLNPAPPAPKAKGGGNGKAGRPKTKVDPPAEAPPLPPAPAAVAAATPEPVQITPMTQQPATLLPPPPPPPALPVAPPLPAATVAPQQLVPAVDATAQYVPQPSEVTVPPPAEAGDEEGKSRAPTPEDAQWACQNIDNMTLYLTYGKMSRVKPVSDLKPTPMNWRTTLKGDGTADPDRWTPNQFMGFYWYRVCRFRTTMKLALTLPGKDFGRIGREINALMMKLGGKQATFNFIDALTSYFPVVQEQLGGQYGASTHLDETTLSNAKVVGIVLGLQQMDPTTLTQALEQATAARNAATA